jgi:hypothetical protein
MKIYIKNNETNILTTTNEDSSYTIVPINNESLVYLDILKEVEQEKAEIKLYTPPIPTWEEIRAQRNTLLQETDWTALTDVGEVTNKKDWVEYRNKLRSLPQDYPTPESVVWPQKPV